jgi:hypothetical protein
MRLLLLALLCEIAPCPLKALETGSELPEDWVMNTPREVDVGCVAADLLLRSFGSTITEALPVVCPLSVRSLRCFAMRCTSPVVLVNISMYRGPILCLCRFIARLAPSLHSKKT